MSESPLQQQLRRQNQQLRAQLQKAHATIKALRQQLAKHQHHLVPPQSSIMSSPHILTSPAITPPMQLEENFSDSSSENETNGSILFHTRNPTSPIPSIKQQLGHPNTPTPRLNSSNPLSTPKRVVFKSDDDSPHKRKQIKQVLKKSSQRKKQVDSRNGGGSPMRYASVKEIPQRRYEEVARSQRTLFRKTSNSRSVFECFFVTGMRGEEPCITYSFPQGTGHNLEAYLTLLYGQGSLRQPELVSSSSQRRILAGNQTREHFVIATMKSETKSTQKDYLVVVESDQKMLGEGWAGWHFPRYYCFLTQWRFFGELSRLSGQLMDRIMLAAGQRPPSSQSAMAAIIEQQIEASMSFLHHKATDYNKTLDCVIGGSGLRFSADIPPAEFAFRMVEKYQRWNVLELQVQFRDQDGRVTSQQTRLFGMLLAYALAQVKLVLFSTIKSKVSEAVLQLLELIRPLNYVNPILMAALRQDHDNYLDAPMSLILALWTHQRRPNKQKIEIYMNRKLNLQGRIEKAQLDLPQGVLINLDTGLAFGGAADPKLNDIAVRLNAARSRFNQPRDSYKMIERMLAGRFDSEEARSAWQGLRSYLLHTQLYSYWQQGAELS